VRRRFRRKHLATCDTDNEKRRRGALWDATSIAHPQFSSDPHSQAGRCSVVAVLDRNLARPDESWPTLAAADVTSLRRHRFRYSRLTPPNAGRERRRQQHWRPLGPPTLSQTMPRPHTVQLISKTVLRANRLTDSDKIKCYRKNTQRSLSEQQKYTTQTRPWIFHLYNTYRPGKRWVY